MALRCFLFSSDEGTAALLRQILSSLGVEAESCSNAVTAAERITNEAFQIVIIDWNEQPEANVLLNTARERKAAERPITLAIVSDDASGPHALHAGANSLLRRPIVENQAKETLTTARDLVRAQQRSPAPPPQAAAAAAAVATSASSQSTASVPEQSSAADQKSARALEALQQSRLRPTTLFEAESKAPRSPAPVAPPPVEHEQTEPEENDTLETDDEHSSSGQSRGLQWYMKTRVAPQASAEVAAQTPVSSPSPSRGNPDLIGFEHSSSYAPKPAPSRDVPETVSPPPKSELPRPVIAAKREIRRESKHEPTLFSSYVQEETHAAKQETALSSGFKKRAIVSALILAAIASFVAPQAPWHPKLQGLWRSGRQSIHAWFNPQPVAPAPAPVAHETFTRAGDEYKLPVAETIPDATTDPSQIKVLPVVDPTAKKPNDGSTPDQPVGLPDASTSPDVPPQSPGTHVPENQTPAPEVIEPASPAPATAHPAATSAVPTAAAPHNEPTIVASNSVPNLPAARPSQPRAPVMPANVPQSLKSQLTSMTPESSGNKAPETALPTIEPVNLTEPQERALLTDQPAPAYPANARGQQGTVTLQVLIGRDGTVQDAKFLQGSLLFARAAIDAVKQWKFKPYVINTRPVSVQTTLTLKFKPAP